MPRGYPDYQSSREPAIALQTVWEDDFEAPNLKWGVNSSAGSTNPILSILRAWQGVQSVQSVIIAGVGEFSLMRRQFPVLSVGRIGIEFFIYPLFLFSAEMVVSIVIYDGTNISTAQLRLDAIARNATIVTPLGNIVVDINAFNTPLNQIWVPFRLVVDMQTDRYVRLFSSPDDIDLSTHALVPGAGTNDRLIDTTFSLESAAGNAASAHIDNFILTQNEP